MFKAMCLFLLCALFAYLPEARNVSSGCDRGASAIPQGQVVQLPKMEMDGVLRETSIFVPRSYSERTPMPLMIWLHGQWGKASQEAKGFDFIHLPMISVYPQGVNDHATHDCGTGWNLEMGSHDNSTCNAAAYNWSCCYKSCIPLGVCTGDGQDANCGWGTCVNDFMFFEKLLNTVANEFCIDLDSVFLGGASFGGMMTHAAYQKMPGRFKVVIPVYGLPLHGYNMVLRENRDSSILLLHGRHDTTIPEAGGLAEGWYYESADDVLRKWAALLECDQHPVPVTTEFDGGSTNLRCTEWPNCHPSASARRVLKCLYDGEHGAWPEQGADLMLWFLRQHSEVFNPADSIQPWPWPLVVM